MQATIRNGKLYSEYVKAFNSEFEIQVPQMFGLLRNEKINKP